MQKEALSALMDGELNSRETAHSLINQMKEDADLRGAWQRYHLVRDALKGEATQLLDINIAECVAKQLKDEPIIFTGNARKNENTDKTSRSMLTKLAKPFTTQVIQFGFAASVAFAVIIGVQHFNAPSDSQSIQFTENPAFNTLPIFGDATQVSLGVPSVTNKQQLSQSQQQLQEQRKRVNAMLQDYELQKRLSKTQSESIKTPAQAGLSVPGTQNLGEEVLKTQ
ncbi:RseA family anti-sigma factor [Thorsellia anophelis]|uniref:Anti-sigma-E factor RseA n=1 Tax=Thorsellia anophelis DSM 18579 TaxID=1123402 RepID=A0A1I0C1D7_9GAMM|nr:RseA family anti-sigma factor [Thorsellia anophelis]SET13166.1 sigma-E factor negative regulatory protein RseA [Thorsellia anophelis DSM 18579]